MPPNIFQQVQMRKPKLNKFNLNHERKMSLNMGELVPILVQDIVPGDKFRVNSEAFLRMAPMLAPIMHRVNVYTHYFFVPNRIIWDEWEDFITGGQQGTTTPEWPNFFLDNNTSEFLQKGSLSDYMGLPIPPASGITSQPAVSALPFRAYQQIYNDYFIDPNLQSPVEYGKGSGWYSDAAQVGVLTQMRRRSWEKDYFTSALPWAQRGAPVSVPLEGTGDVTYLNRSIVKDEDGITADPNLLVGTGNLVGGYLGVEKTGTGANGSYGRIENIASVNLESGGVTINDLRRSIRLQEWLEKNARGGARYVEQILSHFGVVSSDARLQRAEYLGGGRSPMVISEVLQTMQESEGEGDPLGTMGGHGVSVGKSNGFRKRFEEHGYVIGIMSILPKTAYQQGIPRHFTRDDKFLYYWPEFAQIGEQEVKNKELFVRWTDAPGNEAAFGYQSRYSEYKYNPSTVHGDFRDTLDYWHMGRKFDSAPNLSIEFVESYPTHRIFAVTDPAVDKIYCQIYNRVDALRPMPYFGTPIL